MAAARQKEMNVSITDVATKTLIAGRWRFPICEDISGRRSFRQLPRHAPGKGAYSVYCDYRCQRRLGAFVRWSRLNVSVYAGLVSRREITSRLISGGTHDFPVGKIALVSLGQIGVADAVVPAQCIDVDQRPQQPHHE